MEKENHTEDADLSQKNDNEQSGQEDQKDAQDQHGDQQDDEQDGSQEDYRGKLNATNRFLEKEGYEFRDGRWQKRDTSQQRQGAAASPTQDAPALTRDEAIVIARGHSIEELERAKKIAAVEGIGLVEALDTDLFKDWKAKQDKEAKERAAQLPASRGARPSVKKKLGDKGLSDEEHEALFRDKYGK